MWRDHSTIAGTWLISTVNPDLKIILDVGRNKRSTSTSLEHVSAADLADE